MKGTNFRRILCILIAAMLCIGLLPIGAAADSYAAAAELRSMQKVRREIDGELFELESELDSDLSAVDTVDTLFEYLDGGFTNQEHQPPERNNFRLHSEIRNDRCV